MTSFVVHRPSLIRSLGALLDHAGKATRDQPFLGRLRWTMTGDALLIWTGDGNTAAVARVAVRDLDSDVLEQWDTSTAVVQKIRAVFRASSTRADADNDLLFEVADQQVYLTEAGGLLPGEQLKVPRISIRPPEEDEHPDVPRLLVPFLQQPLSEVGAVTVQPEHLAPFVGSAKTLGGYVAAALVDQPFPRVLVQIGPDFAGLLWRVDGRGDEARTSEELTDRRSALWSWTEALTPLQRPEPVRVDERTKDQLVGQARAAREQYGPDVNLVVLPADLSHNDPFTLPNPDPEDHDDDPAA